jgi:metal-responsive CopG/Arc/MetJ family transcriptional regulator
MAVQKEEKKAFTVKFPVSLVEEIDRICTSNYITRTSWLIKAAKSLIEKERMKNTEELLAKLADKEK